MEEGCVSCGAPPTYGSGICMTYIKTGGILDGSLNYQHFLYHCHKKYLSVLILTVLNLGRVWPDVLVARLRTELWTVECARCVGGHHIVCHDFELFSAHVRGRHIIYHDIGTVLCTCERPPYYIP